MKSLFIAFLSLWVCLQTIAQPILPTLSTNRPVRIMSAANASLTSAATDVEISWLSLTNAIYAYEVRTSTNVLGPWSVLVTTNSTNITVTMDTMQRYFHVKALLTTNNVPVYASWSQPSWAGVVSGYNVYYGEKSYSYPNKKQVIGATNTTLYGFISGRTYYFNATSIDTLGVESNFDGEQTVTIPYKVVNLPAKIKTK